MIKIITIIFSFLFIFEGCNAQKDNHLDEEVINFLKESKFNIEIYELAFCTKEVLYLIESDSSFKNMFQERINNSFENDISEELRNIHSIEYRFFKDRMVKDSNSNEFPKGFRYFINIQPNITQNIFVDFAVPFKAFIEFPEQVDDICLIMLLGDIECKYFQDIQQDKVALWKFNNWIEYGFEEFRYNPGTSHKVKGIINQRIINYILENKQCQDQTLVERSIKKIKDLTE